MFLSLTGRIVVHGLLEALGLEHCVVFLNGLRMSPRSWNEICTSVYRQAAILLMLCTVIGLHKGRSTNVYVALQSIVSNTEFSSVKEFQYIIVMKDYGKNINNILQVE